MSRGRRPRGPLVGRTEELAELTDAFEAAVDGDVVVVLVAGDAGLGKTALIESFTDGLVASGTEVHWGHCVEVGGSPAYWPWIQVLGSMGDDVLAAAVDRLAGDAFGAFDSVHDVLRSEAAVPRVVVLDDLHAADLASLELVRYLAAVAQDLPLLVVGAHRWSEVRNDPERDGLLADIARHGRRIELRGIGVAEVSQLLDGRMGVPIDGLAERIVARAGGNPLYVDKLIDAVVAGGIDQLESLPDGIRAAVRLQLRSLPDQCRALLGPASLFGSPIPPAVLASVVDRPITEVVQGLHTAVTAGVLAEASGGFVFEHDLVRAVVADELSMAAAAPFHAALARVLAETPDTASPAAVSQHLIDAGDLVAPDVVASWSSAAASAALAAGAPGEAAPWFELAADAWRRAGLPRREGDALDAAAGAWDVAGDGERSLATASRLLEVARHAGSGPLLARAALAGAGVFAPSQERDGPPLLMEALEHPEVTRSSVRSELLVALAGALGMPSNLGPRADPVGARRAIDELVTLAEEPGPDEPWARICLAHAHLLVDSGPAHHADRRAWLAELVTEGGGRQVGRLERIYWETSLAFEAGELDEVERSIGTWERLTDRGESSFWRWRAAIARSSLRFARGDLEGAEKAAMDALPLVAKLHPEMAHRVVGGLVFAIRREQCRLSEFVGSGAQLGVLGALVTAEIGDHDATRNHLDRIDRLLAETGPDDLYWLCLLSALAHAAADIGDVDRCRRAAETLAPYGDQYVMWGRSFVFGTPVSETVGTALLAAGDQAAAAPWFRRTLGWAERNRAAGVAIRSRVGLARCLADVDPERNELVTRARFAAEQAGFVRSLRELSTLESGRAATSEAEPGRSAPEPIVVRATVRTLGRFEVTGAGAAEPARWTSRKARNALQMLVGRHGEAVPREQLIDQLWPEVDLATGRSRLSVVLTHVRLALDPERILPRSPLIADRQAVALDPALVETDVDRLLALSSSALEAAERGAPDASVLLADAARVGRAGSYLGEELYAPWTDATRWAVERSRRDVLRAAARVAEQEGHDATGWWAQLVQFDPDDDEAAVRLADLLERAGRHGEAAEHRAARARRRRLLDEDDS